jgi:hypothetical protein
MLYFMMGDSSCYVTGRVNMVKFTHLLCTRRTSFKRKMRIYRMADPPSTSAGRPVVTSRCNDTQCISVREKINEARMEWLKRAVQLTAGSCALSYRTVRRLNRIVTRVPSLKIPSICVCVCRTVKSSTSTYRFRSGRRWKLK